MVIVIFVNTHLKKKTKVRVFQRGGARRGHLPRVPTSPARSTTGRRAEGWYYNVIYLPKLRFSDAIEREISHGNNIIAGCYRR